MASPELYRDGERVKAAGINGDPGDSVVGLLEFRLDPDEFAELTAPLLDRAFGAGPVDDGRRRSSPPSYHKRMRKLLAALCLVAALAPAQATRTVDQLVAYRDAGVFAWLGQFHRNRAPEHVRVAARSYSEGAAYWVRIDGLTPGLLASMAVSVGRSCRSNGSPPVSRTLSTPSDVKMPTRRAISSNVRMDCLGSQT